MDYLRGKFGNCSFSCFGFIVRTTNRLEETYRRTHSQTDADERYIPATLVGVSEKSLSL